MVPCRKTFLSVLGICLTGCAAFNPYIRDGARIGSRPVGICAGEAGTQSDLAYACSTLIKLERARSQIVRTRSTLSAALFPIAGIIGYNTLQGINLPTNAVLASGGLAGYSAVTTLAQRDRILIYDQGLASMSCAIGKFRAASAATPAEPLARQSLRTRALRLEQLVGEYRDRDALRVYRSELNGYLDTLDATLAWLSGTGATRLLAASLDGFVLQTVASVNTQLTLTVPDNSQLAGDTLESFQYGGGKGKSDRSSVDALMANQALAQGKSLEQQKMLGGAQIGPPAEIVELRQEMDNLIKLYGEVSATPVAATSLDLAACNYQDVAGAGVNLPGGRLALGAGNSSNGTTVNLKPGGHAQFAIGKGVPPYTPTYTGPGVIDVKIEGANGVSMMDVHAPAGATEGDYVVKVTDASGTTERGLVVHVAK